MALIICPKCGKKISEHAEKCPMCGTYKNDFQHIREEKKAMEAAEQERLRIERETEKKRIRLEKARLRKERRTIWWKTNKRIVFSCIVVSSVILSVFLIIWYLHTPKWEIDNGVLTISPRAIFSATMKDYDCYEKRGMISNVAPWRGKGHITSVIIKDGVKNISHSAFYNCYKITSVSIPKSINNINISAFAECHNLNTITVDPGNTKYDSRNGCNAIVDTKSNTLIFCCKSSTIPNSVTCIGKNAFAGCDSLTTITIPDNVTNIGFYAFCGCKNLNLILPERFKKRINLSDVNSVTYY